MQTRDLGVINLAKMNAEQNRVVFRFLKNRLNTIRIDVAAKGKSIASFIEDQPLQPYSIALSSLEDESQFIEYKFTLSNDILIRESESDPDEFRFEVLKVLNPNDKPEGEGGFGVVSLIEGTLAESLDIGYFDIDNEKLIYKTNKSRINKAQIHEPGTNNEEAQVKAEYELTKAAGYPHVKKPVIIPDLFDRYKSQSHTVMHKLNDFDLSDISIEEKRDISTVDDLLDLCARLCIALDEQISIHGIIHRDIKPENVRVSNDLKDVKILDFGLSYVLVKGRQVGSDLDTIVGTPQYVSPEQISPNLLNPVTAKTDVYSLTIMLGELWKVSNLLLNATIRLQRNLEAWEIQQYFRDPNWRCLDLDIQKYKKKEFFKDLELRQVQEIFDIFLKGTVRNPTNRPNPQAMAEVFEKIRIERKCQKESLDKTHQEAMLESNKAAREARRNIILLQKTPSASVEQTTEIIKTKLIYLDQKGKLDCDEFLMRLNAKVLSNLTDKDSILKKMDDIKSDASSHVKNLKTLLAEVNQYKQGHFGSEKMKDRTHRLSRRLEREINKYVKKAGNLDEINDLNTRMKQALPNYKELFERLKFNNRFETFLETDPGKIATNDAKFIGEVAKKRNFSFEAQKGMSRDFLQVIYNKIENITDPKKITDIIVLNKIDYLIKFYEIDLTNPDEESINIHSLRSDFKKIAEENIKTLPGSKLAHNHLILEKIEDAKKFVLFKAELMKELTKQIYDERQAIKQLPADKTATRESNFNLLVKCCSDFDGASSYKELDYEILDALDRLRNAKKTSGLFSSNPFSSTIKMLERIHVELVKLLPKSARSPSQNK